MLVKFIKNLWAFLVIDRIAAYKKSDELIRSENGILIINKEGVARVDYNKPEAQQKLQKQIDFFASIDLSNAKPVEK